MTTGLLFEDVSGTICSEMITDTAYNDTLLTHFLNIRNQCQINYRLMAVRYSVWFLNDLCQIEYGTRMSLKHSPMK